MTLLNDFAQSRRAFLASAAALGACAKTQALSQTPQPVILDTDIGDDIDDTWALFMLLRSPQLDLKLAVSDFGNARYRTRLLAKLLTLAGRSDVPVGMGLGIADDPGQQSGWLADYQLGDYAGVVHADGVQAIIDTIMASPDIVTLLCIGPVPNIAEALRREPAIAANARFVGMHGSIYTGYAGAAAPAAEWNVRVDPQSLRAVFNAPWSCTIAPLDTCGTVTLDGDDYRRLYDSDDPWLQALMANYRAWLPGAPYIDPSTDPSKISTTLFDTVAVYLAQEQDLVEIEELPLTVSDDGYTVIDQMAGRPVNCAVQWRDLPAYKRHLVRVLLG